MGMRPIRASPGARISPRLVTAGLTGGRDLVGEPERVFADVACCEAAAKWSSAEPARHRRARLVRIVLTSPTQNGGIDDCQHGCAGPMDSERIDHRHRSG